MPINNSKKENQVNKEGIIYALIFVLYLLILIITFTYAIKFLRSTVNNALSTPISTEIENKYGQLDLDNYAIIANKLGLQKSTIIVPVIEVPVATTSEIIVASTTPEIATTSLPEINATSAPIVIEKKPNISVINSTLKSGLAANLKNKLTAASYQVINTSNSQPSLAITTIKVKSTINADSKYLSEIKKIVSTNYDFVVLPLDNQAASDIEIIIGNK